MLTDEGPCLPSLQSLRPSGRQDMSARVRVGPENQGPSRLQILGPSVGCRPCGGCRPPAPAELGYPVRCSRRPGMGAHGARRSLSLPRQSGGSTYASRTGGRSRQEPAVPRAFPTVLETEVMGRRGEPANGLGRQVGLRPGNRDIHGPGLGPGCPPQLPTPHPPPPWAPAVTWAWQGGDP